MAGRILVTGFEPFGGETVNPSWQAVSRLPDILGGWEVKKMQIPVVYGDAARMVWETAQEYKPQVILCVGQAGGRCNITPEVVAINLRDSDFSDNVGACFQDRPVIGGAPNAYFTTLPVKDMVKAVQSAGIPGSLSYSAGAYVCNDTFYTLLHKCQGTDIGVGFIHIPYLPEQAKGRQPSLPLPVMVQALEKAILVCTGASFPGSVSQ